MSEYLKRLADIYKDREQRRAFNRNKSCVVKAGPGSGKTYLLTTKVARLLFEQVPAPRGVACLTYSNLLAGQLEEDFEELGVLGRSRLFVGTVHSFCLGEIIHPYKHLYDGVDLPKPFRISSEEQCKDAIDCALMDQGINFAEDVDTSQWGLRWRDLLRYLNKYRRQNPYYDEDIFEDEAWCKLHCGHILRQVDWAELAQRYTNILKNNRKRSIDFTEIEIIALKMVEQHKFIRSILEARYPWLVIDEYQDLGYPFHRMIGCLLRETQIAIFAIGDPDQCIYEEMQGTKPEYILQLAKQIESRDNSKIIELKHNYRCAQGLINISERILGESRGYQSSKEGGNCLCYRFEGKGSFEKQQRLIAKDILPHLTGSSQGLGLDLEEIAILHPWRRNGINELSNRLDTLESKWLHVLDKDIDYDSRISRVLRWLEQMAAWCIHGWRTGRPYFRDLMPLWIELNTDPQSQSLLYSRFRLEQRLFDVLWKLRQCKNEGGMKFRAWVTTIRDELDLEGLLDAYREVNPDDVAEFDNLVAALESGTRLSTWYLSRFAKGRGKIQLTTLHSSKGTQFEAVIIAGLDKLGIFSQELSEQDRRLAYVSVTRAKQCIYLLFEGMPEVLRELRENPLEGCRFYEPHDMKQTGLVAWQGSLF